MTDTQNIFINNDDTICAISTPAGRGGIAVIRVSGPEAIDIVDRIWQGRPLSQADSHTAHLGTIIDNQGNLLDQAVATVFRAPRSFTGQNTVEISVHGSIYIQRSLVDTLCSNIGARLALPGEFTRRAFVAGRLDLAQSEAVADIIAADSRASHRLAVSQMRGDFSRKLSHLHDDLLQLVSLLELELDFSEEDVEFASRQHLRQLATDIHDTVSRLAKSFATGDAIRRGISVAIVGQTNAGKSTLLNRLLNDDRAIVSDIHGTTRDIIEDTTDIDGICFRFIDTAGLRHTDDTVENLGIQRTLRRLSTARIILWVIDPTDPTSISETYNKIIGQTEPSQALIAVINKSDIADTHDITQNIATSTDIKQDRIAVISANTGSGLPELQQLLLKEARLDDMSTGDVIVTNARHHQALVAARDSIARAIEGIDENISGDFIAQDLRETLHHLSTLTGAITTDDILSTIFSKFCVGK